MSNKRVHRLYQDEARVTIYRDSEPWEMLKSWYTENGLDIGTVIDDGSTIVEDGKVLVTVSKPIKGRKPWDRFDYLYVYQIPVTPLPKELIS